MPHSATIPIYLTGPHVSPDSYRADRNALNPGAGPPPWQELQPCPVDSGSGSGSGNDSLASLDAALDHAEAVLSQLNGVVLEAPLPPSRPPQPTTAPELRDDAAEAGTVAAQPKDSEAADAVVAGIVGGVIASKRNRVVSRSRSAAAQPVAAVATAPAAPVPAPTATTTAPPDPAPPVASPRSAAVVKPFRTQAVPAPVPVSEPVRTPTNASPPASSPRQPSLRDAPPTSRVDFDAQSSKVAAGVRYDDDSRSSERATSDQVRLALGLDRQVRRALRLAAWNMFGCASAALMCMVDQPGPFPRSLFVVLFSVLAIDLWTCQRGMKRFSLSETRRLATEQITLSVFVGLWMFASIIEVVAGGPGRGLLDSAANPQLATLQQLDEEAAASVAGLTQTVGQAVNAALVAGYVATFFIVTMYNFSLRRRVINVADQIEVAHKTLPVWLIRMLTDEKSD